MRLHSLTVEAFGPFADTVRVDFDALAADGLFLLHGQTGAGKTTVLDAVAFALFGRVPGVRQDGRRLHSDHSGPSTIPRVVLEVTLAGRRLRIDRSPEHIRRKARGEGFRKIQARGSLVWVDGSGPELTRLPEIGEAITRLLGMSADQFFQVVLLPQGDFAQFLRATTADREALLEKLFDTERFGGVEEWLRERARVARADLEERSHTVDRSAGQIAAVAGVETPADPDVAWATALLDAARVDAPAARAAADAATAEAERAQGHLDVCTRRAELIGRGASAQSDLARLDADVAVTDEVRRRLGDARRAAGIRSALDDAVEAVRRSDAADHSLDIARLTLAETAEGADLVAQVGAADDPTATVDAALDRWSAEAGRLEPLVARVAGRPAMVADLSTFAAEAVRVDRRLTALEAEMDQLPTRRADLAADAAAATAAQASVPGLRSERAAAEAIVADVVRRDRLVGPLAQARSEADAARLAHLEAREAVVDVRERRLATMAAEIATRLQPGEPCPACGSATHPAPAVGDAHHVTDAEEQAAAAAEVEAGDRSHRASIAVAEIRSEYDALVERLGSRTHDEARAAADDALRALAEAQERAARLPCLTEQIAAAEASLAGLAAERADLLAERSRRAERAETLRTALRQLDDEIAAACAGSATIEARRDHLTRLARLATRFREAATVAHAARDRSESTTRRAESAARDAGFPDVAAARDALVDDHQISTWETTLETLSERRAAARAVLDDPDVAAAQAAGPPDVAAARAARDTARAARDEAHRRSVLAADRLGRLETHCAQFWAAVDVIEPARLRAEEISGLAEVVTGRGANSRAMSLRSYVLAARLEEVVVAASSRLREMSCGRYEFEHSDAAGTHGRRGGLGIAIRDEYTGVVRPAATLSGGETFFASLALALGLADVVSAEAGGRVLDTMFIDEGFGSLDPETLERVMGVLDDLRSGGRVVGLVSHVDEMRSRIPAQLHVIRTDSGSRVEMMGVAV